MMKELMIEGDSARWSTLHTTVELRDRDGRKVLVELALLRAIVAVEDQAGKR